jgi:Fe-S oxidoreductase
MISSGLLSDAVAMAERALAILLPLMTDPRVRGLVVCEPSCLSAIKDDWLQLRLGPPLASRKALADRAMLVEEFVEAAWDRHPRRPMLDQPPHRQILLHGHCHQKALWGDAGSAAALQRCGTVQVLDAGCCGMAGSFGYEATKYATSMQIGELALLPAVRAAADETVIAAPGTSCRQQILHGTGRAALHPIELLAEALIAEESR